MRRILVLALVVGLLHAITSPAQGALNVLSKARIASVQIFDDGRARVVAEYTCPNYDYHADDPTSFWISQPSAPGTSGGGSSATIPFSDEIVCDGTIQRLVKTVRSASAYPFDPTRPSRANIHLWLHSDSDPWPGLDYIAAQDLVGFMPGGASDGYDLKFRRVWINDLGTLKTRLTYACPTGVVYDEDDIDILFISWAQHHDGPRPGTGVSGSDHLVGDLTCDDTPHTIVTSTRVPGFLPELPIQVEFNLKYGHIWERTVFAE